MGCDVSAYFDSATFDNSCYDTVVEAVVEAIDIPTSQDITHSETYKSTISKDEWYKSTITTSE